MHIRTYLQLACYIAPFSSYDIYGCKIRMFFASCVQHSCLCYSNLSFLCLSLPLSNSPHSHPLLLHSPLPSSLISPLFLSLALPACLSGEWWNRWLWNDLSDVGSLQQLTWGGEGAPGQRGGGGGERRGWTDSPSLVSGDWLTAEAALARATLQCVKFVRKSRHRN